MGGFFFCFHPVLAFRIQCVSPVSFKCENVVLYVVYSMFYNMLKHILYDSLMHFVSVCVYVTTCVVCCVC